MAGATRGSARGVTVMLVGSSAWLGDWIFCAALIGRVGDLNSFFDGFAPSLPATFWIGFFSVFAACAFTLDSAFWCLSFPSRLVSSEIFLRWARNLAGTSFFA